ncbi:hypothetical protein HPP92_016674 [Vanilla planifolia]|uniref:Peptidase C1A papain C-terminal domain-containing protein n=1 Tax=Vanilla planifolia TaxID=51239 RepID=A0A835QP59_VANPL|nr:hypothetical protein HPP92_016674 [Vanilla planifolia]
MLMDRQSGDRAGTLLLLFLAALILPEHAIAAKPMPRATSETKILQDSIVEEINKNPVSGWKAVMSPRFSNYTVDQFKHILGVKKLPHNALSDVPMKTYTKSLNLPKEFDARTQWSHCSTIGRILDGCDGGYPIFAWRYFVQNGVVTEECDPYFDQIGCAHPGCEPSYPTPLCKKHCQVKNQVWDEQKHFSVNAYRINSDPYDIMAEVSENGPVEVSFTVFEDFAHYKSGVYKHIAGDIMGGHAVKLIGWGTSEQGEDYWLLANQWNRDWGDDGYFKILRGTNECGIEEDVVAGLPSTKNLIRKFAAIDVDVAASA